MGVGIFCANMPVLRLMFVWMTTGIAGTLASKSSNYQKTADSAPSAPSSHRHTGHLASATKSGGDDDLYTHHGIILHKSYEVEYADKSDVGLVDLEQHPRPPATASLSPSSSSSTNNPGTAM